MSTRVEDYRGYSTAACSILQARTARTVAVTRASNGPVAMIGEWYGQGLRMWMRQQDHYRTKPLGGMRRRTLPEDEIVG